MTVFRSSQAAAETPLFCVWGRLQFFANDVPFFLSPVLTTISGGGLIRQ